MFPKVLKQKNSYMKHMVNVHKKGFECSVCQKIIATEEGLKLHKRDQHKIQIQVLWTMWPWKVGQKSFKNANEEMKNEALMLEFQAYECY